MGGTEVTLVRARWLPFRFNRSGFGVAFQVCQHDSMKLAKLRRITTGPQIQSIAESGSRYAARILVPLLRPQAQTDSSKPSMNAETGVRSSIGKFTPGRAHCRAERSALLDLDGLFNLCLPMSRHPFDAANTKTESERSFNYKTRANRLELRKVFTQKNCVFSIDFQRGNHWSNTKALQPSGTK